MIGKRKPQRELFDVGNVFSLVLDPRSFHGQLARAAPQLFRDGDFAAFYAVRRGRPSVPPSQLALLTLLQHEARVSDQESVARSGYDLRWAAVLGRSAGTPLCAKSTFQAFRAHLVLHERVRLIFEGSLAEARRKGLLKKGPLRIAVDTLPITGAGAVKDTYNLLGVGIWRVIQAVAAAEGEDKRCWAERHELQRYLPERDSSLKGAADIDWSDASARQRLLQEISADALRAWDLANAAAEQFGGRAAESIREAQLVLGQLLLQDVEVRQGPDGEGQVVLAQGVAKDRIPSATDCDQRHGHKSQSNRFTGHKARTAMDPESRLIVDVEILPGNAADAQGLLQQIERVEKTVGTSVATVLGDCAMGNGATRAEFEERGIELIAKVPTENHNRGLFPKSRFQIDVEAGTVTCPAGHCVDECTLTGDRWKIFRFGSRCAECPLRKQCTESAAGRTVRIHPQEVLLRAGREMMATPAGRKSLRERMGVEHRQARLAQLGVKRARYFGHRKTLVQVLLAATIANLRWTWNWELAQAAEDTCVPTSPESQERGACEPLLKAAGGQKGGAGAMIGVYRWLRRLFAVDPGLHSAYAAG